MDEKHRLLLGEKIKVTYPSSVSKILVSALHRICEPSSHEHKKKLVKFYDEAVQLWWWLDLSSFVHPQGVSVWFRANEDVTQRFDRQSSHGNDETETLLSYAVGCSFPC